MLNDHKIVMQTQYDKNKDIKINNKMIKDTILTHVSAQNNIKTTHHITRYEKNRDINIKTRQ